MSITVTALKWVPPFAQGQVRDHRIRWVLNEVGWEYDVRLLDSEDQASVAYCREQPFGQVPVLEETGRATLFESGAIVLSVAERAGKLLPGDEAERELAKCWLFAALNSVEIMLAPVAETDFFIDDEEVKRRRRPEVVKAAEKRLGQVERALGDRDYLVGYEFTVADLMMSSVMKVIHHTDILDRFPRLKAHRDRCFARPAYRKAIADQCAAFKAHRPRDMKWPEQVTARFE